MVGLTFLIVWGSLVAHFFTDRYGRRTTFLIAAFGFIFGLIVTSMANGFGILMLGRFFVGTGVGVGLAIDPMYIAEVTPPQHRGELVSWCEVALNVGILLGFSMDLLFYNWSPGIAWRGMLLLGCIFPLGMIGVISGNIMPESPRWLVAKGRMEEAEMVLKRIYPLGFDVKSITKDIQQGIEKESAAQKVAGWGMIFSPTPGFRRMLVVGIGIVVLQQAVGIDAVQYYLLDVIKEAGIHSKKTRSYILILMGVLKLLFAWIGGRLFDHHGRRKLLFISLYGCAFALLVIATSYTAPSHSLLKGILSIGGLGLYISLFSIGIGPGGWLVASEVFSTSIRAKAMSLATFLNRVMATIMASTCLTIAHGISWPFYFMMLAVVCLATVAFVFVYIPETKGKSLEAMSEYFASITGDTTLSETEMLIGDEPLPRVDDSSDIPPQRTMELADVGGTLT